MLKLALSEPRGTVMRDGTVATSGGKPANVTAVSSDEGYLSVTVAVIVRPARTEGDAILTSESTGAACPTLKTRDLVSVPYLAEIVTSVTEAKAAVEILKSTAAFPGSTTALAGTDPTEAELAKATVMPTAGAGALKRSVPVTLSPPATSDADSINSLSLIVEGEEYDESAPPPP